MCFFLLKVSLKNSLKYLNVACFPVFLDLITLALHRFIFCFKYLLLLLQFRLKVNARGEAVSCGGQSECNALLTRGISFIMGSLCLSLRCSVRPFRPSGSHLHYILDRQDIHAFLTHCPSPWGEGPERDVRTPGWALCPSALFTHPAGDFLSGVTETCVV